MQLPTSLRNTLVDELEEYLEAFASNPDPEGVVNYVVELIELWADEAGVDDIIVELTDSGALDDSFTEALENEMSSNDEFEYTGEEVTSLIERLCEIEWEEDAEAKAEHTEEADDF